MSGTDSNDEIIDYLHNPPFGLERLNDTAIQEEISVQNWNDYIRDVPNQLSTMWNFILYNQFTNSETSRLHSQVSDLEQDLTIVKNSNRKLIRENKFLKDDVEYYKEQLRNRKRKRNEPTKSTEVNKWFNKEKRKKPKDYVYLKKVEQERKLLHVFSQLNNIQDIINLENCSKRFDFFKQAKFKKIFKLIPSLKEINRIIGMEKVKESIFEMICYFVHGLNNKDELHHIVITGPPGTGKTTLASLLGNVYLRMGFLKNDKFIKARRSDLIGKYCGHTAIKTQSKIDEAEGGILFIDEVYSLGNPGQKDVFTKECIDTINQNLTEKQGSFLCIIAGYKDDVQKCFFNYNKGLERRFPLRFNIEPYNAKELYQIFNKFVKDDEWKLEDELFSQSLIEQDMELFKFYGGDMNVLFQYAKQFYSLRLMNESLTDVVSDKILTKNDMTKSITKFKKSRKKDDMSEAVKTMYL